MEILTVNRDVESMTSRALYPVLFTQCAGVGSIITSILDEETETREAKQCAQALPTRR